MVVLDVLDEAEGLQALCSTRFVLIADAGWQFIQLASALSCRSCDMLYRLYVAIL